jgi:1,4-alpha-glucan branching enzyme
MPGDRWQRFANLRAYFAFMWGHPGKKLLFMGGEFGQEREWNHDHSLDWHLLDDPFHRGLQDLMRDLNKAYRSIPALHERDCEAGGFQWIVSDDDDNSVIAWVRRGDDEGQAVVVISNFTPVPRENYRIGAPTPGTYVQLLSTDGAEWGGSGYPTPTRVDTEPAPFHGYAQSMTLTLPPLGAVILARAEHAAAWGL